MITNFLSDGYHVIFLFVIHPVSLARLSVDKKHTILKKLLKIILIALTIYVLKSISII